MESNSKKSSRRRFIERFALSATVLAVTPKILLANKPKGILNIAILGENAALIDIFNNTNSLNLVNNHSIADIFYVCKSCNNYQDFIRKDLLANKYLIVEENGIDESNVANSKSSGSLLTIVKRASNTSNLFEKADYYENNSFEVQENQKVINFLTFLQQNTKPSEFRIKNSNNVLVSLLT